VVPAGIPDGTVHKLLGPIVKTCVPCHEAG
jgi:hypothetical protein